jgi:uncharacterized membrane protein|tara:strand:- start:252 stop:800 length:549 start_codon:yes stop_codon:yes gene_type:complete
MTRPFSPCWPLRPSGAKDGAKEPASRSQAGAAPLLLDVTLYPHRSLSPRGFVILMTALAVAVALLGVGFFLIGAWPVIGFMGLEFVLVYVAFRLSYRQARQFEVLKLTPERLILRRVNHYGRERRWSFQPYWLRVSFGQDPTANDPLFLISHGKRVQVGSFLSGLERITLGQTLQQALSTLR